jgi:hypothetical protein
LHRRPCDIHNYTQASPVLAAAGYRVIVVGFTVRRGRIVAINVLADPRAFNDSISMCSTTDRAVESAGGKGRRR